VIHGVPTRAKIPTIQTEFQPTTLVQTPRWLTPQEKRESTEFGLMVLAFAGSVNLIDLIGTNYLWVGGKLCKSSIYHEFSDATRCTNCQLYGHPPALCQEKSPTCAVCAQGHTTRLHPCKISSCKHGPACTHPPIMCRACQESHKASDMQ
jgi:hypothetical protein